MGGVTSQTDAPVVILDLTEMHAIGGGGLGTLVLLQGWAQNRDIRLKLLNPCGPVLDKLKHVDFERIATLERGNEAPATSHPNKECGNHENGPFVPYYFPTSPLHSKFCRIKWAASGDTGPIRRNEDPKRNNIPEAEDQNFAPLIIATGVEGRGRSHLHTDRWRQALCRPE